MAGYNPATEDSPLMPGWVEAADPSNGSTYYYNDATGEERDTRPVAYPAAPVDPVAAARFAQLEHKSASAGPEASGPEASGQEARGQEARSLRHHDSSKAPRRTTAHTAARRKNARREAHRELRQRASSVP